MKFKPSLISAAAAVALGALSLPAAAVDYYFNSTAVPEFGAPTYGHVELTQAGFDVNFKVVLDPEFNFLTTGNHFVFAFNGNDVSLGDIGAITDADGNTYAKTSTVGRQPAVRNLPVRHLVLVELRERAARRAATRIR